MEFILILMEPGMKATGLMIFKMEKDSKSGKMDPYLKAILEMAWNTEKDIWNGMIIVNIKEIG